MTPTTVLRVFESCEQCVRGQPLCYPLSLAHILALDSFHQQGFLEACLNGEDLGRPSFAVAPTILLSSPEVCLHRISAIGASFASLAPKSADQSAIRDHVCRAFAASIPIAQQGPARTNLGLGLIAEMLYFLVSTCHYTPHAALCENLGIAFMLLAAHNQANGAKFSGPDYLERDQLPQANAFFDAMLPEAARRKSELTP